MNGCVLSAEGGIGVEYRNSLVEPAIELPEPKPHYMGTPTDAYNAHPRELVVCDVVLTLQNGNVLLYPVTPRCDPTCNDIFFPPNGTIVLNHHIILVLATHRKIIRIHRLILFLYQ